jgi:protein dithiol oxidoreductase (disulfide-forming)
MIMLRKICATLVLATFSFACSAQESAFVEGTHFTELTPAQPTSSSPEVIEVVEFFWYGCPHCYAFEPHVQAWRENLPANTVFIQVPATFNALYKLHAKAYYTAEVLGVLAQSHDAMFDAIHDSPDGNRPLDEDSLAAFYAQFGVTDEAFRSTFNSFQVSTMVARAESLQRRYRIAHVPTMIINGRYMTDGTMARNWPRLIEIMSYLVESEAANR